MGGIGGIVKPEARSGEPVTGRCNRMARQLNHRGPDSHGIVVSETEGVGLVHTRLSIIDLSTWSLPDQVSYWELTRYMLNQLLRDSDVMSMANGLELRVPFLDIRLFETVSRVSPSLRLTSKKQLLAKAVPEIPDWVFDQPKRGFAFPFERWMNERWREDFAKLRRRSPVRLHKWYHAWSLFTLDAFLARTGVQAEALVLSWAR